MEKKLSINILTPYGSYLETSADYLSVTTSFGVTGILPNHSPLIAKIEVSELMIKNDNSTSIYAVSGGLINVKEHSEVTILANAIENANEIDIERAKRAKERAELRLLEDDADVLRAKASLARALNRISVYGHKNK